VFVPFPVIILRCTRLPFLSSSFHLLLIIMTHLHPLIQSSLPVYMLFPCQTIVVVVFVVSLLVGELVSLSFLFSVWVLFVVYYSCLGKCLWFLFNTANIYHLCFPLVVLSPTLASPWIQETHQVSNSPLGHFIRIKQKTVITLVSSTIQLMWKMKYAASSSAEPSCSKTSPANYTEP